MSIVHFQDREYIWSIMWPWKLSVLHILVSEFNETCLLKCMSHYTYGILSWNCNRSCLCFKCSIQCTFRDSGGTCKNFREVFSREVLWELCGRDKHVRHPFSSCHVLLILESKIVVPSPIQGEVRYFLWLTIVLLKLFSKSIPPFWKITLFDSSDTFGGGNT